MNTGPSPSCLIYYISTSMRIIMDSNSQKCIINTFYDTRTIIDSSRKPHNKLGFSSKHTKTSNIVTFIREHHKSYEKDMDSPINETEVVVFHSQMGSYPAA